MSNTNTIVHLIISVQSEKSMQNNNYRWFLLVLETVETSFRTDIISLLIENYCTYAYIICNFSLGASKQCCLTAHMKYFRSRDPNRLDFPRAVHMPCVTGLTCICLKNNDDSNNNNKHRVGEERFFFFPGKMNKKYSGDKITI